MAGIINGTPVDAANTNPKFIYKDADDTSSGILTLNSTDVPTGSTVDNIQKELNSEASFTGKSLNSAKDDLPSFTNNNGFTNPQSLMARTDAISAKFHASTGHAHTGAAGDAPAISAANLNNVPLRGYDQQGTLLTSVSGSSTNVSTQLSGKTPSNGSGTVGVVVNAPYNKIILRQGSGVNTGDEFLDTLGNVVYGRLTEAATVWTLSFYVLISNTETSYTFISSDIDWYYQELFNPMISPPVYSQAFFTPSDNSTSDVVDASATQRGLVSTGVQTFAGAKTFNSKADLTQSATLSGETASRALITDGSKDIRTSSVTSTELGYVSGVTSAIQTQLNGKEPTITTLPISKGGTNSGTALTGNKAIVSNATQIIESSTTDTEIGYLSGVTSAIQTQLNSKATDTAVVHLAGSENITGTKTFTAAQIFTNILRGDTVDDSSTTGSNATLPFPSKLVVRVTNASLVSISQVSGAANSQFFVLINKTGVSITVKNAFASGSGDILTGTGADLTLTNNSSLWMYFDPTSSRTMVVGGSGSGGGTSFTDSTFNIYDDGDITKIFKIQCSGISTSTTRTMTIPDADFTAVGTTTTQTLTNKTLSGNTATSLINGSGTFNINSTGAITVPNSTDTLVGKNTTDTLTNKTLTTPTIADFTNATHNHSNAAGGGQISLTAAVTGVLPLANGGTNNNNTASAGAVIYSDSTKFLPTAVGTSGQVLQSNGTSAPSWATAAQTTLATTSKTANYTATTSDDYIFVSGATFTITLFTPVGNAGKLISVHKTDSSLANVITVSGTGLTSITLNTQDEVYQFISDGTNLLIKEHKIPTKQTAYTPTFTGFGSVTVSNFLWWREGANLIIDGTFTVATETSTEKRVSFPTNLTSASGLPTISMAGLYFRSNGSVAAKGGESLKESSVTYFTISTPVVFSTTNQDTLAKASTAGNFASGDVITFRGSCPISGWNT
jgi:hypothetical protein